MEKGNNITNSLCYLSYPTGSQYSVCPPPRTDSGLKIKHLYQLILLKIMRKLFYLKALMLSLCMAVSFVLPVNAQTADAFINDWDGSDDELRGSFGITIGGAGLIPQGIGEPAPLGSGLLIMSMLGAGYAVARRRRSLRKGVMMLMACVLLLGMTQCKKSPALQGEGAHKAHITLRVEDNSRVIVDTTNAASVGYAAVSFENGDKMYVGYNKTYVGYLTYSSGNFTGDINIAETVDDEPLYFYFLGGKGFEPTFDGNVATLDISDQVIKYPVINYAHSAEVYPSATGDYTARLLNKCAIVKFHVNKPAGYDQAGTCITGMNNLVTVDFDHTKAGTDEGFTYSLVNEGAITIPSKIGDVWAVLLPQDEKAADADGAFSGRHKGTRPTINAIVANDYISTPYELDLSTEFQPTGALSGLFKVNADGKMVRFSKANLKATTTDGWNTWTWRFKDTQYEYETAGEVGTNYANRTEVSLFSWATSGYNIRGVESSDYYYKPNNTMEGHTSSFGPGGVSSIVGEYAKGDWGYNRITNEGYYQWRCLTSDEWTYLRANHTTRWVKITGVGSLGTSCRCYGVAILPYNSSATLSSEYTVAQWEAMESDYGAILFPVCGFRAKSSSNYSKITQVDTWGYYWASTNGNMNNGKAYMVAASWYENNLRVPELNSHLQGMSVRLVCE